jgi:hypothetical protein
MLANRLHSLTVGQEGADQRELSENSYAMALCAAEMSVVAAATTNNLLAAKDTRIESLTVQLKASKLATDTANKEKAAASDQANKEKAATLQEHNKAIADLEQRAADLDSSSIENSDVYKKLMKEFQELCETSVGLDCDESQARIRRAVLIILFGADSDLSNPKLHTEGVVSLRECIVYFIGKVASQHAWLTEGIMDIGVLDTTLAKCSRTKGGW